MYQFHRGIWIIELGYIINCSVGVSNSNDCIQIDFNVFDTFDYLWNIIFEFVYKSSKFTWDFLHYFKNYLTFNFLTTQSTYLFPVYLYVYHR